jgi:hypothetical protein
MPVSMKYSLKQCFPAFDGRTICGRSVDVLVKYCFQLGVISLFVLFSTSVVFIVMSVQLFHVSQIIHMLYLLTYSLTPWSRVILEKLIGLQLVKKLLAFYGTRRFITAFTSAPHLYLS